ncbi:hypothetical protein [Achromobacter xylosoxidans]|nr:hypothetical protein [Achromobacter xylosoxidans]
MTKEEAQARVNELHQAIQENEEENRFMQEEIDRLDEEFDGLR